MFDQFHASLAATSPVAPVIISIAAMLFLGFAMTRITKLLRLPNVTAYILTGVLIGPYGVNLVPADVVSGMDFLSDIALAFIAFSTGEFFRFSTLRKNGAKVALISVADALISSSLVFTLTYFILKVDFACCIVLSALASATAPASLVMTIRQTRARGDFVDTLLQVIALDDVISLIAYSVAISVALSSMGAGGTGSLETVIRPVLLNIGVLALGGVFGLLLKLLMSSKRTTDNRLIVSIAVLFAFCGVCTVLGVSPLLGCMSMGTVYINISKDENLFKQLNYFSPPIMLLFFVKSGLGFRLDALLTPGSAIGASPLLLVSLGYFAIRIIGKYAGAFIGCRITGKPANVRNYLGMALIPQAGVAIGLAALGARTLGGEIGPALQTVILASSVLYEFVGPVCAKLALYLSGSYSNRIEDIVPEEALSPEKRGQGEAEILIERIRRIREELPAHSASPIAEDEAAFTQAALEEQQYALYAYRRRIHRRR